ncbi:MAG: hypothetical protein NW205_00995 [Hyphomicrobiaceae bacterium]|nr:hypothetical protein [Hyphomicrobiaceae bacterium]
MLVGRLWGVSIHIDPSFLLLAVLLVQADLMSGSTERLFVGVLFVLGIAVSILLHELGHAAAGARYGSPAVRIDLNGLGGLCTYANGFPAEPGKRIVMALAGPVANLVIWMACAAAFRPVMALDVGSPGAIGWHEVGLAVRRLGEANFVLLIFNLMPAWPLDGAHALSAAFERFLPGERARLVVGWLGLAVAVLCALMAVELGPFTLLVAALLAATNRFVLTGSWPAR